MSARTNTDKVLRIGVIQGGRIVEERIIPRGRSVTIGDGAKNTFVMHSAGLPVCMPLLVARGGRYQLAIREDMEGKISVEEGSIVSLEALHARSLKQGDGSYLFPLEAQMRGKVTIAGTTFLFQFVAPPKLARGASNGLAQSWFRQLDNTFCAILAMSAVLHGVTVLHAMAQPRPQPVTLETIPDRFIVAMLPPSRPPIEPPSARLEPLPDRVPKKPAAVEVPPRPDVLRPSPEAMRPEDRIQRAADSDFFKVLITKLPRGDKGTSIDVPDNIDLTDARDHGRIRPQATVSDGPTLKAGAESGEVRVDAVTTLDRDITVEVASKERHGPPPVMAPPEVVGGRDKSSLDKPLKRYMGAVTRCYEQALNLNPGLRGKLYLDFTVEASGRVSRIAIHAHAGSVDPVLKECLEGRMQTWAFPPSKEGAADISLPIVFTATESL